DISVAVAIHSGLGGRCHEEALIEAQAKRLRGEVGHRQSGRVVRGTLAGESGEEAGKGKRCGDLHDVRPRPSRPTSPASAGEVEQTSSVPSDTASTSSSSSGSRQTMASVYGTRPDPSSPAVAPGFPKLFCAFHQQGREQGI